MKGNFIYRYFFLKKAVACFPCNLRLKYCTWNLVLGNAMFIWFDSLTNKAEKQLASVAPFEYLLWNRELWNILFSFLDIDYFKYFFISDKENSFLLWTYLSFQNIFFLSSFEFLYIMYVWY